MAEFLWYIPNEVTPGHRGDAVVADHNTLATLTEQAVALEDHGWKGALLGTGWGRPDTFTVAAALAARTTTFEPDTRKCSPVKSTSSSVHSRRTSRMNSLVRAYRCAWSPSVSP